MEDNERWYGLWNRSCYFCGHDELFLTNEHYHFCPNCLALFTFPIIHKGCGSVSECIKEGARVPVTLHQPVFKSARKKVFIKAYTIFAVMADRIQQWKDSNDRWCCSKCGGEVEVDGW